MNVKIDYSSEEWRSFGLLDSEVSPKALLVPVNEAITRLILFYLAKH